MGADKNYQARRLVQKSLLTAFMVLVSFTMLLPFLWMISSSFKDSVAMFQFPIRWIPQTFNFSGYQTVWNNSEIKFSLFFTNSIKVTFLAVIGTVLSCSMGGYAMQSSSSAVATACF